MSKLMDVSSRLSKISGFLLGLILVFFIGPAHAAATQSQISNGLTLAQQPIYVGNSAAPIVMLDITKDHQLYYRAYNDYTDLNGDGVLSSNEITYSNTYDYYGYFDTYKCYKYDATNKWFAPTVVNTDHYCNGSSSSATGSEWSGNFLNWVAMSRMDVLRKVLYGGMRSTDTATQTVLERAFMPFDAHSWVKYYNGSDLNKLTPFASPSPTTGNATMGTTGSSYTFNTSAIDASNGATISFTLDSTNYTSLKPAIGDQINAVVTGTSADFVLGAVNGISSSTSNGTTTYTVSLFVPGTNHALAGNAFTSGGFSISSVKNGSSYTPIPWGLTNLTYNGASFCNTSYDSGSVVSQNSTAPPLIRAVYGDYRLWSSSERVQCVYTYTDATNTPNGEIGYTLPYYSGGSKQNNNGNLKAVTGLASSSTHPPTTRGAFNVISSSGKPDYVARVAVCVTGLIGKETCRNYPNGENKPYGLLQQYGEGDSPTLLFGLFTGSYDKNISGGVLRRTAEKSISSNASGIDNETDPSTGIFVSTTKGMVWTINHLRQYGYNFPAVNGQGSDGYMTSDNCTYQLMGMVHTGGSNSGGSPGQEGNCSSWGNPIGEMYLETLRYLAGTKSPTSAFTQNISSASQHHDLDLSLPAPAWDDPLSSTTYCRPLNIVNFSASVNSYDIYSGNSTQYAGISDLNGAGTGSTGVNGWTDELGANEGINGTNILIGGTDNTSANGYCNAKKVTGLSSANGICPEAPSLQGSYLISGLAYYAHTHHIRSDLTVPAGDHSSLKVRTYGVQLASSLPVINVPVTTGKVTITPAYSLNVSGKYGTGTLVNFFPLSAPSSSTVNGVVTYSATYYVDWEDSNQGGDYDQDVWGFLTYSSTGNQVTITTQVAWAASANGQAFGFNISGTDHDGPHFFTGAYGSSGFIFSDNTTPTVTPSTGLVGGGCYNACEDENGGLVHSVTFQASTSGSATQLKDPLYYAAKWGAFKDIGNVDSLGNPTITTQTQWDATNNTTGLSGSDQQPDTYFYVNDPAQLIVALQHAFSDIANTGSSSALAANSTSWQSSTVVYQAGFNSEFWAGWLLGLTVDPTTGNTTQVFTTDDYNQYTATQAFSRLVITDAGGTGVPFRYANLTAAQQAILQGTNSITSYGADLVTWLRGDDTNNGENFRTRTETRIGDIVNSSPMFVGTPVGQYDVPQTLFRNAYINDTSYLSWASGKNSRSPVIYVGANDGMLHGFWAQTSTVSPVTQQGAEAIAYVPNAIYSKLPMLPSQSYVHTYTVDGSPGVADANLAAVGASADWRTVLVGGYGAGGRGLYALDVSDPTQFTEANANKLLLWEFSNSDDADLGWTFSKPVIAKMNDGRWAAIVGNGYFQTNDLASTGDAQLFIIYLNATRANGTWALGTDYVKIATKTGSLSAPNGLSTVTGIDLDGNGTVDAIYGGDLKGNVWKFDVSSSSNANWAVAYGTTSAPAPLVTVCGNRTSSAACLTGTKTLQPIVNKPALTFSPVNLNGVMVYIGTGKYIETSDASNSDPQSMYGIYDNPSFAGSTTSPLGNLGTLNVNNSNALLIQKITTATTSGSTPVTYRTITNTAFTWTGATANDLWLEDLPVSGERVVGTPRLANGVLFYNTYIPSTQSCATAGDGWTMAVMYDNGGLYPGSIFDVTGDGNVNANDPPSAGVNTGGTQAGPTILRSNFGDALVLNSTTTGTLVSRKAAGSIATAPRIGWRELFK